MDQEKFPFRLLFSIVTDIVSECIFSELPRTLRSLHIHLLHMTDVARISYNSTVLIHQ